MDNPRQKSENGKSTRRRRRPLLIVLIVIILLVLVFVGLNHYQINRPYTGPSKSFTIIADLNGYNDSRVYYPNRHPILNATFDDRIIIQFVNHDAQARGIQIQTYITNGEIAQPGQTITVTFQATKAGLFNIDGPIFTTVYAYEHAQLNIIAVQAATI